MFYTVSATNSAGAISFARDLWKKLIRRQSI